MTLRNPQPPFTYILQVSNGGGSGSPRPPTEGEARPRSLASKAAVSNKLGRHKQRQFACEVTHPEGASAAAGQPWSRSQWHIQTRRKRPPLQSRGRNPAPACPPLPARTRAQTHSWMNRSSHQHTARDMPTYNPKQSLKMHPHITSSGRLRGVGFTPPSSTYRRWSHKQSLKICPEKISRN